MKTTYVILGIAVIAIVLISAFSYAYLSNPNQPNSTPTPTPNGPTATSTPSTTPSSPPNPTANPTGNPTPTPTSTPQPVSLTGAGATFPVPFLNSTLTTYMNSKPWLTINYQGVGSGTGISSLTNKVVDFAGSDAPLTDDQRNAAPNVLHIPETIGAVVLAYNVPGVSTGLHLTGDVIAKIYLGTITNWNDQQIAALNPTVTLPDHTIITVHRSESSGTTNVFTKYLCLVSPTWNSQVGSGTSVQWPGTNTIGASGNANVAALVEQTDYSIGYVELAYALQNNIDVAAVQNPAGNWIMPTLASTTAAVSAGASQGLPAGDQSWISVSLLNTNADDAYPIVTFSYLMVYKELNVIPGMTQAKATAIVQMLWYIVHEGQNQAPPLSYATLPANVVAINEATINSITFNGQTLPTT
jgi:phosphate transport system substrate-binding protein